MIVPVRTPRILYEIHHGAGDILDFDPRFGDRVTPGQLSKAFLG